MPFLVLLLSQLCTFAHDMRYCFTFLVTHSTKWCFIYFVFHIVCLNCLFLHNIASASTFKSVFLSKLYIPFSSVVSGIFLTNCPYILLFFHSSFFSLIQLYFNSFLFTVSLYSIVSSAFTPSINGSTEFLTYHPKLFSSILIHSSQLINPIPLLLRYTLPTSLLGCSAPYIVINVLVILSKLFNSSLFHFRIPTPYLIAEATQV